MAGSYIIDEFSPYDDPDEEAAKRRAEASGRPVIASPAPDVENPAPAPEAISSPAAPTTGDPAVPPAEAPAPPAASQAAPPVAPPAQSWGDQVRGANTSQTQLAADAASTMRDYSTRVQQQRARRDAVLQQRSVDATPIAARDENGQVLQQYKPSFAQRLLRGVAAVSRGGVFAAADPTSVGVANYGAPNSQYARDLQTQGQRVGADDATIAAIDKGSKDDFETAKGMAQEARSTAGVLKDVTGAATAQQNAETSTAKLPIEQETADNNSPKGKADAAALINQAQMTARTRMADQMKLMGTNRTLFMLNGRIPDPRQATSEDIARGQAAAAWHRDNPGKQPTLADINSINQAAGGRASGASTVSQVAPGEALSDAAYEAEAQQIAKGEKKQLPQNSRSSPVQVAVMKRAFEINPKLTDALYTTRQNFKTKGDADKVQSLGIAISHASNALENSAKVGYNPLINHPGLQTSGPATASTAYSKDMILATDEMGKLIKNGVVTQKEGDDYKERMMSSRQDIRDAALKEFILNFGARARGLFQKYKVGSGGSEFPAEEMYDAPTLSNMKKHGVFDESGQDQGTAPPQSGQGSSNAFKFSDYAVAQ